jgi:hypothetical protein
MWQTPRRPGDITEAIVLAEFLKAGFPVLVPFGDNRRYDLVVEVRERFLRVQCKTASLTTDRCGGAGCIRFKARSGVRESRPYRGQADLFGAYSPETGQVYVIEVDEVPETDVWLRLTPARNNNQYGIRLAEDHTLAAWATRQAQVAVCKNTPEAATRARPIERRARLLTSEGPVFRTHQRPRVSSSYLSSDRPRWVRRHVI